MSKRDLELIRPGEMLLEEFLEPTGVFPCRLAKDVSASQRRIGEIAYAKGAITADTALRLGRCFGMVAQFWLNLKSRCDAFIEETRLGSRLGREVRPRAT